MRDLSVRAGSKSRILAGIKKLSRQKYLQGMALIGIIWMMVFAYLPMYGIIIAFKKYNITKPIASAPWVGLQHFNDFFGDDKFIQILTNTLGISLLKLAIGFPLPIIFAVLLNEITSMRFKKYVQTVSYLPHFISWVVLGGIMITWTSEGGIINHILMELKVLNEPVVFLAEPQYFWGIAVISDIWKELGWSAIIYMAAIAGIDPELYEAATVDGASRFNRIFMITLPCIKGTVAVLFVLAVSSIMGTNFDQIFVLKNPLNAPASDVIDIYVYRMGMNSARFSYATAINLFKSVISLMLLLTANRVTKKLTDASLF
ncbi:carbohydrate ABC transporter membrane protein 1 (CUT1 family) [Anaerobacterium chartisolvens]|uniref:Carbohydrate ABC transporter membrane protein 1 (CUT1 family) n=1 Tax=Anaerobacterium chartisolvens TaxID=1297424 RepID=A0A369AK23_9FIRM|nr:ABC transporter permease subunit [Anaerobacterium chartisolvens]RCX08497.1 carbohydrate ABC transporter membrane protein 1 (CUT1 family) [Anaerobacterium chartisolvens]